MKTRKKILLILLIAIMVLEAFCISFAAANGSDSSGDEMAYTNAYNDLIANKSFNPEEYPQLSSTDEKYYSLEVITIAESVNGELFVYVYQPSCDAGKIKASHISIARSERNVNVDDVDADGVGKFEVYTLTYLNNYKQFYKYKVDDLEVSSDTTRYYEISDILRPFNEKYGDKDPGADNTVSAVPYAVGKLFTFTGTPGERSSLSVKDMEYITITEKYVGHIRYDGASAPFFNNGYAAVDSHFVAFDTDKPIDKLLEADVYYETCYYAGSLSPIYNVAPIGGVKSQYAYLNYEQSAEINVNNGFVLTPTTYTRNRIQRTSEFLNQKFPIFEFGGFNLNTEAEFQGEALEALAKTKWVLNFVETEYYLNDPVNTDTSSTYYTRVGNVKILRLKFETDGKIYDLGVVDNMQTGSPDPSATIERQEWWQKIMMILLLLVLLWALSFLQGPLGAFFKFLWNGIKILFKILVWILSRPWAVFRWMLGELGKRKPRKPQGDGNKPNSRGNPEGG